jgi:hypothetical protein
MLIALLTGCNAGGADVSATAPTPSKKPFGVSGKTSSASATASAPAAYDKNPIDLIADYWCTAEDANGNSLDARHLSVRHAWNSGTPYTACWVVVPEYAQVQREPLDQVSPSLVSAAAALGFTDLYDALGPCGAVGADYRAFKDVELAKSTIQDPVSLS